MPPIPQHLHHSFTLVDVESSIKTQTLKNLDTVDFSSDSSHSPRNVNSFQVGHSVSSETNQTVSIGSTRSGFVPVNKLSQHAPFGKNRTLLPPSTLSRQSVEKNSPFAVNNKNKPVDYRFKPILPDEERDMYPDVKKSVLSSKARRRKHVPFSHIHIKSDDSCSTVSSISYDSSEFDVDVLYSFAAKYNNTSNEANKELLRETNELIERIAKHNIGGFQEININADNADNGLLGITKKNANEADVLQETNGLLDQIHEMPLPPDIASLIEEGEDLLNEEKEQRAPSILENMDRDFSQTEERHSASADEKTGRFAIPAAAEEPNQQQQQHQHQQQHRQQHQPAPSHDLDLSFRIEHNHQQHQYQDQQQQQQPLPPDIAALVEDDNDLSFDDLRDDIDDQEKGQGKPNFLAVVIVTSYSL